MDKFERSLSKVLVFEGGYSNHPADRGGRTNMGIRQDTLSAAYAKGIVAHKDIGNLTKEEAKRIYRKLYWAPCQAEKMEWPLCLLHFDDAVNCGVGIAGKMLQKTINSILDDIVKVDGIIGPKTLRAIEEIDTKSICLVLLKIRKRHYEAIVTKDPSQKTFLDGWLNRIKALQKEVF